MIPGRPTDTITVSIDNIVSSNKNDAVLSEPGEETQRNQVSAFLLYASHVTRGFHLAPTPTWLPHRAVLLSNPNASAAGQTLTVRL